MIYNKKYRVQQKEVYSCENANHRVYKGEGTKKYRLSIIKCRGDANCSIGNTVSDIVVAVHGGRQVGPRLFRSDHLVRYIHV